MIRVAFLIRSLFPGGAERQLLTLAANLNKAQFDVRILTFYGGGELMSVAREAGIRVDVIGKRGRYDIARFLLLAVRELRAFAPDVLCTFLAASNIFGALVRGALPNARLVWTVRDTDQILHASRVDKAAWTVERLLSRFADAVIANSDAGKQVAAGRGFPGPIHVVRNGVDATYFQRTGDGRTRVRAEWHVDDQHLLVGIVARVVPVKDHATFLRAAQIFASHTKDARFACVGHGESGYVDSLRASAKLLGLDSRIVWIGPRDDLANVYSALDICTLTSVSEGCPNVLVEAQMCETPVVSTDVGDARMIVGRADRVVPVGDAYALAFAWKTTLERPVNGPRAELRKQMVSDFSIEALVRDTSNVFSELVGS